MIQVIPDNNIEPLSLESEEFEYNLECLDCVEDHCKYCYEQYLKEFKKNINYHNKLGDKYYIKKRIKFEIEKLEEQKKGIESILKYLKK